MVWGIKLSLTLPETPLSSLPGVKGRSRKGEAGWSSETHEAGHWDLVLERGSQQDEESHLRLQAPAHAPLSPWTSLYKALLKDKIVKDFKTSVTEC